MAVDRRVKNLRDEIKKSKREFWEIQGRIKELEEQEERLEDELERVRDHLSYYQSLVSDIKKKMKSGKSTDIFERF